MAREVSENNDGARTDDVLRMLVCLNVGEVLKNPLITGCGGGGGGSGGWNSGLLQLQLLCLLATCKHVPLFLSFRRDETILDPTMQKRSRTSHAGA